MDVVQLLSLFLSLSAEGVANFISTPMPFLEATAADAILHGVACSTSGAAQAC